jgi:hypothetical protein
MTKEKGTEREERADVERGGKRESPDYEALAQMPLESLLYYVLTGGADFRRGPVGG